MSLSARSSAVGLGNPSLLTLPPVLHSAQPQPDGDVYLINVMGAKGALNVAYTADKKLLTVGDTAGGIRVYKTGKSDELCCLSLQLAVQGRSRKHADKAEKPWAGKAVAVTCLRPWPMQPAEPTLLASYADGKVRLWDVMHGVVKAVVTEDRQCLGMAVAPDSSCFVTLGEDGGVHLYDAETFQLVTKMEHSGFSDVVDGHKSRTFSGAFHPLDPNCVATGGWDNLIQFWDIRLAQSTRHCGDAHVGGTESLDFSANGNELMSCSWRNNDQLQIWDSASATLIETLRPDRIKSYLYAGRYLSENMLCCGGSNANLFRLVHIGQKVTVGTISGLAHGVFSIALGPIGAQIRPNPSLNNGKNLLPHNKYKCPRVAVCSDSKVMELEVY
ncbi:POC1 centriolar protein homolog A-like [Thrips palmi]|uniref:POC1 centriolar protein homolog A-like n=1 Tax=Thrips palmi TaxID=161013 RepID=A0A6P8YRQ7_THRPL|nr:POC1 centriolar protein homolog A-like [Thrips palmi]